MRSFLGLNRTKKCSFHTLLHLCGTDTYLSVNATGEARQEMTGDGRIVERFRVYCLLSSLRASQQTLDAFVGP